MRVVKYTNKSLFHINSSRANSASGPRGKPQPVSLVQYQEKKKNYNIFFKLNCASIVRYVIPQSLSFIA